MKLNIPKIENMLSGRNNVVSNQFIIHTKQGIAFQSYATIIAYIRDKDGQVFLDKNSWDYSVTTSKYRNLFLEEDTEETRAKIKDRTYKLTDLNK